MLKVRASIGECNRWNFIIRLGLWSAELIGSIRKRIFDNHNKTDAQG